jgi:hypothetical protein
LFKEWIAGKYIAFHIVRGVENKMKKKKMGPGEGESYAIKHSDNN